MSTTLRPAAVNERDACAYCGVSRETFRRARDRGEIVARYPTARPVYLVRELDEWIASWSETSPAKAVI